MTPHTCLLIALCVIFIALISLISTDVDAAALPPDPKRVKEIATMLPAMPRGVGRPITDRKAWLELAAREEFKAVIAHAETLLATPVPAETDELYLEFSRSGNRSRWEAASRPSRARIDALTLAECLEDKGRFVSAIDEHIHTLCALKTWVQPPSDKELKNFKGLVIDIDLVSSRIGWALMCADYLLGDRLKATTRQLLRQNVTRRIIDPYREMISGRRKANFWFTTTNNWNAVCHAGVVGCALALLEDPTDRAFFVAAAEKLTARFLSGFTPDGYCTEGVSYWNPHLPTRPRLGLAACRRPQRRQQRRTPQPQRCRLLRRRPWRPHPPARPRQGKLHSPHFQPRSLRRQASQLLRPRRPHGRRPAPENRPRRRRQSPPCGLDQRGRHARARPLFGLPGPLP